MSVQTCATIDDLYGVEGKAELIGGRIVRYVASGYSPSRLAICIARKLEEYAEAHGRIAAPVARTVACYRPDSPDQPVTFRAGEVADAEPALSGWRAAVDWLFG